MKRIVLAVATLALATGCATVTRQGYIDQEVGGYEYDKPLSEVWPHARALLREQGFALRETANPPVIRTEWKEEMANSAIAAVRVRYLVEGFELRDKQGNPYCTVRITRNDISASGFDGAAQGGVAGIGTGDEESGRDGSKPTATVGYSQQETLSAAQGGNNRGVASTSRDLRMEWQLMQRADPENAKKLEEYAAANYK